MVRQYTQRTLSAVKRWIERRGHGGGLMVTRRPGERIYLAFHRGPDTDPVVVCVEVAKIKTMRQARLRFLGDRDHVDIIRGEHID